MSSGPQPPVEVTVPPASPPPAPEPSLGGIRELLIFLLGAVSLFPLVQYAGLFVLVYRASLRQPGVPWHELARQVAERIQYDAFFIVPLQLLFYALLVLLLYFMVCVVRGLRFGPGLAVRKLPPGLVPGILVGGGLLAIAIQFSNVLVPPPHTLPIDKLFTTRAAAFLIVSVSILVAPVVEELVFRGYIYTLLERLWGMTPAVLASGLLFGAIHFPQLWPGYFQMLLLCFVGIVLSYTRARTGTVIASMLLHFAYNGVISALFLLSPQFRALPFTH